MNTLAKARILAFVLIILSGLAFPVADLGQYVQDKNAAHIQRMEETQNQLHKISSYNSKNFFKIKNGARHQIVNQYIDSCKPLAISGATYFLTANVAAQSGTCFPVLADSVTLDCNGYAISGGAGSAIGVSTSKHITNVKNCKFIGFEQASIYIEDSAGGNVAGNTISLSHLGVGIAMQNTEGYQIRDNEMFSVSKGIVSSEGSGNIFDSNNISSTNNAMTITLSDGETAISNDVFSLSGEGLVADSSSRIRLVGNRGRSNPYLTSGISAYWVSDLLVESNDGANVPQTDAGVYVTGDYSPAANRVIGNKGSGSYGIFVASVYDIEFNSNAGFGLYGGIGMYDLLSSQQISENIGVGGEFGICANHLPSGQFSGNFGTGGLRGISLGNCVGTTGSVQSTDITHNTATCLQCEDISTYASCGLYLQNANGNSITSNTASSDSEDSPGVILKNSNSNLISENSVLSQGTGLMMIDSPSNSLVENTLVSQGGQLAADLGSSSGNSFEGNMFEGSVVAASMQNGIFSGNTVDGTVLGLTFNSISNTEFSGNTITSSLGDAVVLRNGVNNNIEGNELVSQADIGAGLLLEGIHTSSIEGNTIVVKGALAPGYAVALTASGSQGSTGNTVKENTITSQQGSAALKLDAPSGGNAVYHNDITAGTALHTWIDNAAASNVFFTVVNGFGQGNKYTTGTLAADDEYQISDGNGDGFAEHGMVPFTSSNTNQWVGVGGDPNPASRYCGAWCQN
jgi:hypothetical protein